MDKEGLRRLWIDAFVRGAKWWEYEKTKFTMWQSDQHKAEEAAEKRVDRDLNSDGGQGSVR